MTYAPSKINDLCVNGVFARESAFFTRKLADALTRTMLMSESFDELLAFV